MASEAMTKAQDLKTRIYEEHPCGCCWHVVLDDGNWERHHIDFCAQWARDAAKNRTCRVLLAGDAACFELANLAPELTDQEWFDVSGAEHSTDIDGKPINVRPA